MMDCEKIYPKEAEMWTDAIYKEKWVSITVRYDQFYRFIFEFAIPFADQMTQQKIVSGFYHRLGLASEKVIQLKFRISQYHLDHYLKPRFYKAINGYFSEQYLAEFGFPSITEQCLDKKVGLDGLDLINLKLLGMEEYYINPITFSIGMSGGLVLSEWAHFSSSIIIDEFKKNPELRSSEALIEKSLTMNLLLLYSFFGSRETMLQYLSWVVNTLLNLVQGATIETNPENWKQKVLNEMESNFQAQKEIMIPFFECQLEELEDGGTPEGNIYKSWLDHCFKYKKQLEKLRDNHQLPILYDLKKNLLDAGNTIKNIDDQTYQLWQIAYYMMNTINGQLGMGFNLELNLFYITQRSMALMVDYKSVEDLYSSNSNQH